MSTHDSSDAPLTYAASGVDTDAAAAGLSSLLAWVGRTMRFREGIGEALVPNGFFANVLRMREGLAIAISTDGVGSKSAVAQMVGSYESIGWDCVAVNVNDVLCVGAEPVAMVDYIALQKPHADLLGPLGKGLHDGAERARVAIVGGELSQHPDTLIGPRDDYAFDISGTCIGVIVDKPVLTGANVTPGDVIIALPSNGIHANGLTLARRALFRGGQGADRRIDDLGHTVGEELLRPTAIYVPEVMAIAQAGIDVKGLAHISGDGLLNILRLDAEVGYRFDTLPEVPPVFRMIQREGRVSDAEMWQVFNMGVGFCIVVAASDADRTLEAVRAAGTEAVVAGEVIPGPRLVHLPHVGLTGTKDGYAPTG